MAAVKPQDMFKALQALQALDTEIQENEHFEAEDRAAVRNCLDTHSKRLETQTALLHLIQQRQDLLDKYIISYQLHVYFPELFIDYFGTRAKEQQDCLEQLQKFQGATVGSYPQESHE
jgi:hypothetical protein